MAYEYKKRWATAAEFEAQAKARYGESLFDNDDDPANGPAAAAPEPEAKATLGSQSLGGGTLESYVLCALCWNETLAGELVERRKDASLFTSEPYRVIAQAAFDYYAEYKRPPRLHLSLLLERYIKSGSKGRFVEMTIDDIAKVGPGLNEAKIRSELDKFFEIQRLIKAVNEASDFLYSEELERAQTVLGLPVGVKADDDAAVLANLFDAGEDGPIKPREWLLGTTFCRGFLSALVAAGMGGKTTLRLVQALAVATGKPLTEEHVHRRGRVLYLTFEDGLEEMRRRVRAARLHHKIAAEDLKGWLFLRALPGEKLAVGGKQGIAPGRLEHDLRVWISQRHIDLVIIDPFVKSYGGDIVENDNSAIDAVCEILIKLSIELNFAPDALHHDAKGAREPGDIDRGRGASAFRDAARLVRTLTTMTKDEAEEFDIAETERRFYFRCDDAKVNLAPAGEAMWFQLVPVAIPSGDTVQTVKRAFLTSVIDIPGAVVNDILDEFAKGLDNGQRYSEHHRAKEGPRAAWRVVEKHCPHLDEKQCGKRIAGWLKSGLLYSEVYDDPIERKKEKVKGLFVDDAKRRHYAAREAQQRRPASGW